MALFHVILVVAVCVKAINSMNCLSCTGFSGSMPPGWVRNAQSDCMNANNNCAGAWCIKTTDPRGKWHWWNKYSTFIAGCHNPTTFDIGIGGIVNIENGKCYEYNNGVTPPRKTRTCFCNNKEYCNGQSQTNPLFLLTMSSIVLSSLLYQYY